jgi:hypothetical protein
LSLRPWPLLSAGFAASHKLLAGLEPRAFGAFLPKIQTMLGPVLLVFACKPHLLILNMFPYWKAPAKAKGGYGSS